MNVNKLRLKDFRNYDEQELSFLSGVNIIYGDNAQGKTNILEAIHMFSMGKSNRTPRDTELIKHGKSEAEISMEYEAYDRSCNLEIELSRSKRKSILYNEIPLKKISELLGKFNVVYFGPELLGLVKGGPSGRRKNLDMLISQLRPNYFSAVSELKRIVESKNALLKMKNPNKTMLDIMNEKLTAVSTEIISYRCDFIKRLEKIACETQKNISSGREELSYRYMSCIGKLDTESIPEKSFIREKIADKIEAVGSRERELRETVVSPHREDICFDINGKDAKAFASQGQQKTVVLVEKLSEVELIKNEIGETPLLLLDDIMSELDRNRQAFVLENIKKMQIIITCTDIDEMKQCLGEDCRRIYVEDGKAVVTEDE